MSLKKMVSTVIQKFAQKFGDLTLYPLCICTTHSHYTDMIYHISVFIEVGVLL